MSSYIPVLKWRQGEYMALSRLAPTVKNHVKPIFQPTPPEYDFEQGAVIKTYTNQLTTMAQRYKKHWGNSNCYIDTKFLDENADVSGVTPTEFLFNTLSQEGFKPTPAISLTPSKHFHNTIKRVVKAHKVGVCIKIVLEDGLDGNLNQKIIDLLASLQVQPQDSSIIFELEVPNFEPIKNLAQLLKALTLQIPHLNLWDTFGICASSFPLTMKEIKTPFDIIPRKEWELYKELRKIFGQKMRTPNFGDYAINHPSYKEGMDMRMTKPYATLRYTISDNWLIYKGKNVRDHGFVQYYGICDLLRKSEHYLGKEYSLADEHIHKCARKEINHGNLSTWRWVGSNHHITKVVQDLSSLHAA